MNCKSSESNQVQVVAAEIYQKKTAFFVMESFHDYNYRWYLDADSEKEKIAIQKTAVCQQYGYRWNV